MRCYISAEGIVREVGRIYRDCVRKDELCIGADAQTMVDAPMLSSDDQGQYVTNRHEPQKSPGEGRAFPAQGFAHS